MRRHVGRGKRLARRAAARAHLDRLPRCQDVLLLVRREVELAQR
jgi:hypothetical protein